MQYRVPLQVTQLILPPCLCSWWSIASGTHPRAIPVLKIYIPPDPDIPPPPNSGWHSTHSTHSWHSTHATFPSSLLLILGFSPGFSNSSFHIIISFIVHVFHHLHYGILRVTFIIIFWRSEIVWKQIVYWTTSLINSSIPVPWWLVQASLQRTM